MDVSPVLLCKNRLVLQVGFSILSDMLIFFFPRSKAHLLNFEFLKNVFMLLLATAKTKSKKSTAAETKAAAAGEKEEVKAAPKAAPARPKPATKAPAKPLPELMAEDVIPSLKTILEAQDDLSEIELSFQDNKVSALFSHLIHLSHKWHLNLLQLMVYESSHSNLTVGRFIPEEGLSLLILGLLP